MKQLLVILTLLTPFALMGQSRMNKGMMVGDSDGNRILVDSIIETDGATQLYYGGVPYEAVNADSLIEAESVGSTDKVVISTGGVTQGSNKGNFLSDVYADQEDTDDSLTIIRTDLNTVANFTVFDSIVLSDDQTKVYGYWNSPTGTVRVIWDVEGIDDPTVPTFVSAVVQNAFPSRLLITMSEYMKDSVTEYSGGAGTNWVQMDAAYNFDESTGNLLDRVGSDDGVLGVGMSQGDSTGIAGTAYYFDGASKVDFGTGINYGTNDHSGHVVVKPLSLASDFRIYSGSTNSFFIGYNAASNGLWVGKGGGATSAITAIDLTINEWNFIDWAYDQTANTMTIWIGGTAEVLAFSEEFSAVSITLGSTVSGGSYLTGLMDDLFLFDSYKLVQSTVDSLRNSGVGRRYNESGGGLAANQDTIKNAFVVNTTTSGNLTPDSVYILNEIVRLDLPSPVIYSDVVTVAYTQPTGAGSTEGLRDTADNYALTWAAQAATNNVDTSSAADIFLIKTFDYTGEAIGTWSEAAAASYYGTVRDNNNYGNTFIVNNTINGVTSEALQIRHESAYHGAEVTAYIDTSMLEAYLSYHIRLDSSFQSLNNGKVPGFKTLLPNTRPSEGGRDTPVDGFTAKLQMKRAGHLDTYHYDDTHWDYTVTPPAYQGWTPWDYGQHTGSSGYDTIFLTFGSTHKIDERVIMNTYDAVTGLSDDNGVYEVALNDHIVFQETGISFHDLEKDTNQVHGIHISHFWNQAPGNSAVFYSYLDNFKIYIPRNSLKLGLNLPHDVMWDSPNTITEDWYKDDSITNAATDIRSPAYPSYDAAYTNHMYLVDAGVGNVVTLDWTTGDIEAGNYVVIYDGATVGSKRLIQIENDNDLSGNANVVSSGRYMYIYYSADDGGGSVFDADITFAP